MKDKTTEGKTSSMVVPKVGLQIQTGDDEDEARDECLMYPGKNDQQKSADQTLLHYKN